MALLSRIILLAGSALATGCYLAHSPARDEPPDVTDTLEPPPEEQAGCGAARVVPLPAGDFAYEWMRHPSLASTSWGFTVAFSFAHDEAREDLAWDHRAMGVLRPDLTAFEPAARDTGLLATWYGSHGQRRMREGPSGLVGACIDGDIEAGRLRPSGIAVLRPDGVLVRRGQAGARCEDVAFASGRWLGYLSDAPSSTARQEPYVQVFSDALAPLDRVALGESHEERMERMIVASGRAVTTQRQDDALVVRSIDPDRAEIVATAELPIAARYDVSYLAALAAQGDHIGVFWGSWTVDDPPVLRMAVLDHDLRVVIEPRSIAEPSIALGDLEVHALEGGWIVAWTAYSEIPVRRRAPLSVALVATDGTVTRVDGTLPAPWTDRASDSIELAMIGDVALAVLDFVTIGGNRHAGVLWQARCVLAHRAEP